MEEFTKEEIENLKHLAEHAPSLVKEIEYREAIKLVFGRWRQGALIVTSTVAVLFVLRDYAIDVLQGLIQILGSGKP